MRNVLFAIALLYSVACVLSLAIIVGSQQHWFGMEADPLAAMYALMLGLPWTLLLRLYDPGSTVVVMLMMAVGMGINTTAILWIATRLGR